MCVVFSSFNCFRSLNLYEEIVIVIKLMVTLHSCYFVRNVKGGRGGRLIVFLNTKINITKNKMQ